MKRKICVITGSRADYGLLKPLMDEIMCDGDLQLQLVVTGMHLSDDFGLTYREIKRDSLFVDKKVNISLTSDKPAGILKSIGLALARFTKVFDKLNPDIIVLLGDRFEILAAAIAAHVNRIPIAHINGGELTEGVIDEAFRHSITKMSCLHFTATEKYRKRVIQLGEAPDRVFNVGAIGLDNIRRLRLLSRQELEKELGFTFAKHNFLVTFHPVTLEGDTSRSQFKNLLDALDRLEETKLIFTKANADTYGRVINRMIDTYVKKNIRKAVAFTSMGQIKYLSTMRFVDAVVGNSSSGIIEAPSLNVPTINIGDRQKGRLRAKSIIDSVPASKAILNSIRVLYSGRFQRLLKTVVNPYGDGNTAKRIKRILKYCKITNIIKKHFYDINFITRSRYG